MEADQLHVTKGEEALEVLVTESREAVTVRHVHGFYFTGRGVIEEFVQAFTVLVKTGRFILVRVGRGTIGLGELVELGLNSCARVVAGSGVVGGSSSVWGIAAEEFE